jgi:dihydroflavonol-4-reductase
MSAKNNLKTTLVTGATGFVGINLVHALLEKGYKVACLVRNTSKAQILQNLPVQLLQGDLHDLSAIQTMGSSLHTVYHAAGAIKAPDRNRFFQINQAGTRNLLETLTKTNPGLNRFIYISSLAAAGPSAANHSRTEDETPSPISWYGESKLAAENEVLQFKNAFATTILRPSAVYGPYDKEIFLIFRMIKLGCLITPGRHVRQFSLIHVSDLVNAMIKAGESTGPTGGIYHISRPEMYLWEDVGRAIARELGKSFHRISLPEWMAQSAGIAGDFWTRLTKRTASINSQKVRELLEPSWLCDSSRAQEQLGFNPTIDLESGIRSTIRWYKNQGWL